MFKCKKYKKGNILKGLSLKKKIIISIVAILTAILCAGIFVNNKQIENVHAANPVFVANKESGKETFSAKFAGDVILSVEKVLVDVDAANKTIKAGDPADTDTNKYYANELNGSKHFYQRTESSHRYIRYLFFSFYYRRSYP